MPDIIITPSSGKLEFVDNSAQVTRRHSFTLDANNGVNFDAPLSAAAISAPLNVINVTVNNSNVNYPFVLASGSAETGTKTLMMDGAGGTYNPFTNLATIDISGNAATTTLASDSTNLGGVAAASYVTLTGTQTLTNKTITGTFTGNLTGTGSWATNAVNANTAINSTQLNGQAASYYQTALNGTGFVKISGTTISYDNSTYTPTSRTITAGTGISGGGDLSANRTIAVDDTVSRKYTSTINNVTSSAWTTVCNVVGDNLSSAIRATFNGTSNSVVVNVLADILVNHFQDIIVYAISGFYSKLTIRIITNNDASFTLQVKHDGGTSTNLAVEIFPLNTETITFNPGTLFSTTTFDHICEWGVSTSGNGGNNSDIRTAGIFYGAGTGLTGTATNLTAGTATNATQLNAQAASYYTNIPARLGYTPVNQAGDTISGNLTVNGNFAVNGSVTAFSASNIYITSSNLTVTDNILIMNALSPYQRYAGIQMYDSGSNTLSQFLWDGEGDYFFLTGSAVNGKIITGPDGQTNLTANYIPKATAGYKLGNSLIYDNGTNVGIGTTSAAQKLDVVGNIRCVPASSAWAEGLSFSMPTTSSWGGLRWRRERGSADGNHYIGYIGTDTTDDLVFGSNNGGTQIDNNIRITKAGLVGIGTSSPSYKLDVGAAGNDVVSVRLTPGYERVRYYGFDLLGYNDGNLWMIGNNPTNTLVLGKTWDWDNQIGIAYTPGTIGNSGGILQIGQISKNNANYTHGITRLYTNGLERITIIANGNVGISTTLPTTPLHVVGVISGSSFSGAGTGLTGTASGLSIGGSAASSTTAGSATTVTGTNGQLLTKDIRTIAPNNISNGYLQFGFTSWTNNSTGPWADYLHLRSYTDATGGNDNLVMFRKDILGMRIWQQTFNSASAYSTYKDVCWTDGTNASGTWAITSSWAANAVTALNVGNGTITIAAGTGVGVGTTNTFTTNQSGATTVTITNTGVTSLTTNTGLSANVSATGAVTVTNTGVTSLAGTTNQVSVNSSTGGITISLPQNIHTGATPTFASVTATSFTGSFTGSGIIATNTNTADSAPFFTLNGATNTERAIIIQDAGTNKWWFGRDNNGTVQTGIGFYNYGTSNFEFYITDAGTAVFRNAINGSISGNAATTTTLQTARNIGGVSFNGSADINLPGVNTAGNQNTSGNAATATNSTQLGGVTKVQLFNNTGNNHTTYTTFGALPDFGFYFMQGQNAADAPAGQPANQYYVISMGLGNDYAYSAYVNQIAFPRINVGGGNNYLWIRQKESNTWGSWGKVYAGYADSAAIWTTARTLTIGSTGKSVNGSADVSWTLAELGAAATNQTMYIGTTAVAINRTSSALSLTGVSIDGNAATATTATTANALNTGNSYTGVNFTATGYLQTNLGQIKSDTSFALLTTTNGAQSVSVRGILLGTSYDTTPGSNEIRTTNNTSLYLNARGTGDIQFQTADSLKMMLLNNGNVGIGTSNPGRKLDVEGIVRTRGASGTGGFEISAATTGTAKWRIEWDSASDSLDFNWVG